ncbi:hypothetical protein [Streptomyces sp. NPDC093261]|uniref:hypothetical protein n=1 Tax=Streptomyces sp. NPDC093261 TaxID=3366037 RepID=UPI00381A0582
MAKSPRKSSRTIEQIERDHRAVELRRSGLSYPAIAQELGVAVSSAFEMVRRGLRDFAGEAAEEVREMELQRLDRIQRAAERVLATRHLVVNQGRVMTHPVTGEPLVDDDTTLRAIDRILAISKHRADLLGIKAPVRIQTEVIPGGVDAEIARLASELAGMARAGEGTPPGHPEGVRVEEDGTA